MKTKIQLLVISIFSSFVLLGCFAKAKIDRESIFISKKNKEFLQEAQNDGGLNPSIEKYQEKLQQEKQNSINGSFETNKKLARLYLLAQNLNEAEKHALIAQNLDFKSVEVQLLMANIAFMRDQNAKAKMISEQVIDRAKDPEILSEARNLLAGIAIKEQNDPMAIQELKLALESNNENHAARMNLCLIYMKNQEYNSSLQHLNALKKLNNHQYLVDINRAKALAGLGKISEAEKSFQKIMRRYEITDELLLEVATFYFNHNQFKTSLSFLREYIKKDDQNFNDVLAAKGMIASIRTHFIHSNDEEANKIQEIIARVDQIEKDARQVTTRKDLFSQGYFFTTVGSKEK